MEFTDDSLQAALQRGNDNSDRLDWFADPRMGGTARLRLTSELSDVLSSGRYGLNPQYKALQKASLDPEKTVLLRTYVKSE